MNYLKAMLLCTFLLFNVNAMADYACPSTDSKAGGWVPEECTQVRGYVCPANDSKSGGWLPPECGNQKMVACPECGVIESVNMIETSEASGLGAVAGAVAGGLLGNQVGKGSGKKLSTLLGAVAGGVGGHFGEKMLRKKSRWDVVVLMDDETRRSLSFDTAPLFKTGDKVKVKVSGDSLTKQ